MSVDPEEVAREDAIIEIEGRFLRAMISEHAKVWVDFAENANDGELVEQLHDLIDLCDESTNSKRGRDHVAGGGRGEE